MRSERGGEGRKTLSTALVESGWQRRGCNPVLQVQIMLSCRAGKQTRRYRIDSENGNNGSGNELRCAVIDLAIETPAPAAEHSLRHKKVRGPLGPRQLCVTPVLGGPTLPVFNLDRVVGG